MSKITRVTQKIFGSSAGFQQVAQFGSLAASAPTFSTDPAVIQSLSNYLGGWFSAVLGGNSPAIEDMNALCYLYAYQLAYLMQEGVPEWDSGTTYYKGSIVSSGGQIPILFSSQTDSNLNNAVTVQSAWLPILSKVVLSGSSAHAMLNIESLYINTSGSNNITLPDATLTRGLTYTVKNVSGTATVITLSAQTIDGNANYVLSEAYAFISITSDGANWNVVAIG